MRTQPITKSIAWTQAAFFPRVQTRCRRWRPQRKDLRPFPTTQPVAMETRLMNRLPGLEPKSRGQETAVFGSLALAGLAVIAFALAASVHFVSASDEIAAALANKTCVTRCGEPVGTARINLTNLTTAT